MTTRANGGQCHLQQPHACTLLGFVGLTGNLLYMHINFVLFMCVAFFLPRLHPLLLLLLVNILVGNYYQSFW